MPFGMTVPPGSDCIEQFQAMQNCLGENADYYGLKDQENDSAAEEQTPVSEEQVEASEEQAGAQDEAPVDAEPATSSTEESA